MVRGLRLESDLARALIAYAEQQARAHDVEPNIAAAARDLLRKGLSLCSGAHSCEREGYFRGIAQARRKMAEAGNS